MKLRSSLRNNLNVIRSTRMIPARILLEIILCPKRWTVRTEALASIAENYEALQLTWHTAKDAVRDIEMRACIGGVAAQMEHFNFFLVFSLEGNCSTMWMTCHILYKSEPFQHVKGKSLFITQATFQSIKK